MRNLQRAWPAEPGVSTGRSTPAGHVLLTDGQEASHRDFKAFAASSVEPFSGHWDRECVEDSIAYAARRKVGDRSVGELGMIRSLIAAMGTDLEAGRLLCHSACRAQDDHLPEAFERTLLAKYFTARAAVRAASDSVQIQGASGCHGSTPVSRYYRDAKIMEIIEGTTQIHEDMLGKIFVERARRPA